MSAIRLLAALGGLALSVFAAAPALAAPCESLAQLKAQDVTITTAKIAAAPGEIANNLAQATLATPLCRVGGFITPTKDSHIGFEVWLPATDKWNHKLEAVGNGGLSGALNYRAMTAGFNRGYATMTTDLGHTNTPPGSVEDASWAMGHPEKIVDYAYRAEHLSTLVAKQIVTAYYEAPAAHAFYSGCSAGGIQGLNEALRYPGDFDGYIVGDATPDHLGQEMGALWNTLAASLADEGNALKAPEIALVHKAILAACAGKDGGAPSDPFLSDPSVCRFDVKSLTCKAGQTSDCLSAAQVAIFEKIYAGPRDPKTHQIIVAGMSLGSEAGWDKYFVGKKNPAGPERPWGGFLADMVYSSADYLPQHKYLKFDFNKDYAAVRATKVAGETYESSWTAHGANLDPIRAAGGKVIQYHGWDDPNIPSLEAVRFYKAVVADQAKRRKLTPAQAEAQTAAFYRLFMAPGMGHCNGGDGPSSFGQNGQRPQKDGDPEYDMLAALERWVEQGTAPERFIGSRVNAQTNAVDMTRPICPYPKVAVWDGKGKPEEAASFACAAGPAQSTASKRAPK